jgi:S-disulfanyl-L-cysteine oxidoreductase SoxD
MKNRIALVATLMALALGAFATRNTMADSSPKSQWDGVYTKVQAQRGEPLYAQNCFMCHGQDLLGGEMAPPLIGGQFQSNWNEQTLGDLFERILVSMPLNAPGSLSRQQTADVLAYVLTKDNYPTGQSELPTQTQTLKEIKFLSAKP